MRWRVASASPSSMDDPGSDGEESGGTNSRNPNQEITEGNPWNAYGCKRVPDHISTAVNSSHSETMNRLARFFWTSRLRASLSTLAQIRKATEEPSTGPISDLGRLSLNERNASLVLFCPQTEVSCSSGGLRFPANCCNCPLGRWSL